MNLIAAQFCWGGSVQRPSSWDVASSSEANRRQRDAEGKVQDAKSGDPVWGYFKGWPSANPRKPLSGPQFPQLFSICKRLKSEQKPLSKEAEEDS